ncbi:hypothetical protein CEXT_97171 [Caerostris extrusa]|uniref:Uncharacterized protein n=1 Tax=Caerostris extrusa TaxID=172846 RepID=A0AAV4NDK0_CAEEX|nr:hypothetical protein CEXT_97171 [Caerostris extrusa]
MESRHRIPSNDLMKYRKHISKEQQLSPIVTYEHFIKPMKIIKKDSREEYFQEMKLGRELNRAVSSEPAIKPNKWIGKSVL